MSRDGSTTFDWADGTYKFRLGIGECRELQEKTDCGPYELLRRVDSGTWRIDDLVETIRIGLIGGGLAPVKAKRLVDRYCGPPFIPDLAPARAILMAALVGAPDGEKPGKRKAAKAAADAPPSSQTESSPSPPSMEPAQS
jgi:hypothetical protein